MIYGDGSIVMYFLCHRGGKQRAGEAHGEELVAVEVILSGLFDDISYIFGV